MGSIGSLIGGAIGSAVLPGIGAPIGAALGGMVGKKGGSSSGGGSSMGGGAGAALGVATGLLQTLQANKLKRQADSAMPDLIDPNQSSYLAELNQKRKSIATGADFATGMQAADTTQAGTNDAILSASGGDTGSAIQGLLQAQSVAGQSKNQALGQGQQQQFGYDYSYGNMLNQISARKLQLQMYRSQQARAEQMQKKQTASQNINAGVARMLSGVAPAQQPAVGGGPMVTPPAGVTPSLNNIVPETVMPSVVPKETLTTLGLGAKL